MFKMKLCSSFWIFFCGLLFHLKCTTSNTTVTDSSFLNLVIESSTSANFDKQLKTNIDNSSDLFSSNNVNTELHSNLTNEECISSDCTRQLHTSPNTDSSSSASKILWNLVSTVKSTTAHPSISDEVINHEESTVSSFHTASGTHTYNHSNEHDSSYFISNELDSEINSANDMLEIHPTKLGESTNNTLPIITSTTEPTVITTEIMLNKSNTEGNYTTGWESTEVDFQTVTSNGSDSDLVNVTEYSTTSSTEAITASTDDELDFTTHFLDQSYSFDINSMEELDVTHHTKSSTSESPHSPTDAVLSSEYNDTSTMFSVNDYFPTESTELKSSDSELHKTFNVTNTPLALENKENITSFYINYDISLDSEEGKSTDMEIINITDSGENKHTSSNVFDLSTEAVSYELNGEAYNITDLDLNTETSSETSKLDVNDNTKLETTTVESNNSSFLTLNSEEQQDTSPRDDMDYSISVNTDSTVIVKKSTNSTEHILLNSTQESTNESSLVRSLDDDSEQVTESSTRSSVTTIAYVKSIITSDFSSFQESESSNQTEVFSTPESFPVITSDSSDRSSNKFDIFDSHDLSFTETTNDMNKEQEERNSTNTDDEYSATTVTDPNIINIIYLSTIKATTTQAPYYSNLNEINNLTSVHTHDIISSDSKIEETSTVLKTSTVFPETAEFSVTVSPSKETNPLTEINVSSQTPDILSNSNFDTEKTDTYPDEILTSTESLPNETYIYKQTSDIVLSRKQTEYNLGTENFHQLTNSTEHASVGMHVEDTVRVSTDASKAITSSTESASTSDHFSITISNTADQRPSITESNSPETYQTEDSITTASEETSTKQVNFSDTVIITDTKYFDTVPLSTQEDDTTSPTFTEVSSLSVTETHREGKHIPFSSTLVKITTQYPKIFNGTRRTYSHPEQTETTENNFVNPLYSQISAEELSPEERTNLINTVVRLPDRYYSKEELNEKIAVIHLWFLHSIADEYKNATLSSSRSNAGELNEIEFENLPEILYVLPTPDYTKLPNLSFTFVVHNKWRNETFPVDIILTILNLRTENLKKLTEIEEIHFSHGLFVQSHDLLSVIIEKYGIILLSTCLLTVGMILLLICVVIYYRRKNRHSAHCLTDDKLHRNMQEAMGIDLNPAVIILQDEIREKAALNGNKICSLDDDEGWLAPMGDVPVEDNNAPFVQDTKL